MSEENNILPPPVAIPDASELYFEQFVFDASKRYETSPFLFGYKGVRFSPLGGIQAVSGQKKNGKTFFTTMLMAVALEPNSERVKRKLEGLECYAQEILGHELVVLYVDTEMESVNTSYLQKRVHWLCGWPLDENHPRFHILRLRTIPEQRPDGRKSETPVERKRIIDYWLDRWSPDLLVIDGLRDLVRDFNDNAESVSIISQLMASAETRNICIWNALHYNPRPGNDDESKMRGHLGTELGNKVSDTFVCSKKKDAKTGMVSFTVRQIDARSKDVADIHFIVADNEEGGMAIPEIVDGEGETTPLAGSTHSVEELKQWISKHQGDLAWPAKNMDFQKFVLKAEGVTSEDERKYLTKMAINRRLLIKQEPSEMEPNQKVPRLKINRDEIPF